MALPKFMMRHGKSESSFFVKEYFVENIADIQKNIYKKPNHTALSPCFFFIITQ